MRVLSQTDLENLKSKNITVVGKRGRRVKPKAEESEKMLRKIYARVFSSAEDILSQLGGIKNTLIKVSEFIASATLIHKQQAADREIQTQKIVSKIAERKDIKKWRFDVVRNNRGFITSVIATAEED